MDTDTKELGNCLFIIFVIAAIIFGVFGYPIMACNGQAEGMGYASKWGPIAGCRIEVEPGKWVPIENYRYTPGE